MTEESLGKENATRTEESAGRARRQAPGWRRWSFKRELNPFELVVALTSLVTLVFLYIQGQQIEDANRVAAQNAVTAFNQLTVMQQGQRAFVSLDDGWDQGVTSSGLLEFTFTWRNSGATVARAGIAGVTGFGIPVDTETVDFGSCFDKTFDASTASQRALGPGATTESKHRLPMSIVRMISDGISRGYICGMFIYRDVFDGSPLRLTEFCKVVDPINLTTEPDRIHIEPFLTSCNVHNCFDEDCPDYWERVKEYERIQAELGTS